MGTTCCCLSNSSPPTSNNASINDRAADATNNSCKLAVVTSTHDRTKSTTNASSTPQVTDSSAAGNSLGHLSPAVYGNDSHTNSDIIRPIIVSHSRNHSTSSGPLLRTKSVDGSPLVENIPHRHLSVSGSSRDGVVRVGDPHQDSIRTPNADFDDLPGFHVPPISVWPAAEDQQPVQSQPLVTGSTSIAKNSSITQKQQHHQSKTPMWSGSDRDGAVSGDLPLPGGNSLFDFAVTSPEVDLEHRLGSKSGSITSPSGNTNTLFSFLEHVSTSSKPALDDDTGEVINGALFGMSSPVEHPNSNTIDNSSPAPLDQKWAGSLTQPPSAQHRIPSYVSSTYSSSLLGNLGNSNQHQPNDASIFESTDTTATSSSSVTRQGATVTDSPSTQGESSALMSMDVAIPGMDDGLMNGLTELPDNFFAQLGGNSAPFGGDGPGTAQASPTTNSALDGGSLFAIAGSASNDEETPRANGSSGPGGSSTPLNGTDLDPRSTLLSWATEGDKASSHAADQYQDIDYSDAAFLSKYGGNPLSKTVTANEVSAQSHQADSPETVHIEVASLFSLIPAEETSQFSFGGRKRVANPFGGRKNKGKLDRSIIFQPNNSWKDVLPTSKTVDSAGESSTTINGSSAAATTKDVISLEGRTGKKENPLIKYLKNDLEEEAASDGGSSTVSSVEGTRDDMESGEGDNDNNIPPHTASNALSNNATTTPPLPPLPSITTEDQQRRLERKEKRRLRREERETRMREELELQYRARVAAAAQRKEMNKQARREEMRKTLLAHPSIVAVARSIGMSVIQTSERLCDPQKRSTVGHGGALNESSTMKGWPTDAPSMGTSPTVSQQEDVSPDASCNVSGGAGQLFNIVMHQPHSTQSNGSSRGGDADNCESIGASLLCAETKTTAIALSNNNSTSDSRSTQPREDWLVAVANDLLRSSPAGESPLSPIGDDRSPPIPKSATSPTSLSKGEELLIEAVNKMCTKEAKDLVDVVIEELPRNRRKQQAAIKSRNERCAWGMYHNPVVVMLANAVATHIGSTTVPTPSSSSPAAISGPPPSHSILFTGRSIAVEDPTSVTDPAYAEYLTPMAIEKMHRIPKRCTFLSRAHIPCTPARSQVTSSTTPKSPTSTTNINNNNHKSKNDSNSQPDALTTTQVPVLVAGISSWGRMPGSNIPKSIDVSHFRTEVEAGMTTTNATTDNDTHHITNLLSSMHISNPPATTNSAAVHLSSSPSMPSALSLPETTYLRSTHRSHAVVSFKPTVTLLTTKMASDCVVSISVPSAIMTTKRRKKSRSGSQSVNSGAHSSMTSLFSLGSDDVDTITNLVVHPVPYQVQPLQAPGNPQLIGPTIRPLIARHQELFAAAAAQAHSESSCRNDTRSPTLDDQAKAAGITDDDLAILMRLSAVSRRGISPPLNRSGSSNLNSSSGTRPKGSSSMRSDTTTASSHPVRAMGSSITSQTFRTSPHASLDAGRAAGTEHTDAISRFGLHSLDDDDFVHEQSTFRGMTEDGKWQLSSLVRGPPVGLILTNNGTHVAMSAPDLAATNSPSRGGADAGMQGSCSSAALIPSGSLAMHSRGYSEGSVDIALLDLRRPASAGASGSITSAPTSTSREVHPRRAHAIAAVRREQKQEARRMSRASTTSSRATTAEGTRRVSPRRAGSVPTSPHTSPTSTSINIGCSVDSGHISLFHIESTGGNPRNTECGTSTSSAVGAGARNLHGNISLHNLSSAHVSATTRSRLNDSKLDSICSAASSRIRSNSSNRSPLYDDVVSVGLELIIHAVDCKQRGMKMMTAKGSPTTPNDSLSIDDSEGDEEEALIEIPLLTNTNQEANFARHLTLQKSADGGVSMVSDGSVKGSSLETAGGLGGGLGGSVSQL